MRLVPLPCVPQIPSMFTDPDRGSYLLHLVETYSLLCTSICYQTKYVSCYGTCLHSSLSLTLDTGYFIYLVISSFLSYFFQWYGTCL